MSKSKIDHKLNTFCDEGLLEIGVDEAGRGPLFGRVYAGAVIWPPGLTSPLIRDSKKLNEKQLKLAYDFIIDNATAYATGYSTEKEIDDINILKSTMIAMHRAIKKCCLIPDQILVDGNYFSIYLDKNDNAIDFVTVKGGDDIYYSIAAASILAKKERDDYIYELCDEHPELDEKYNLKKNKGYGTLAHRNGIKENGISQFHRKTFGICKKY